MSERVEFLLDEQGFHHERIKVLRDTITACLEEIGEHNLALHTIVNLYYEESV